IKRDEICIYKKSDPKHPLSTWYPVEDHKTNDVLYIQKIHIFDSFLYLVYTDRIHIFPLEARNSSDLIQTLYLNEINVPKGYRFTPLKFHGEAVCVRNQLFLTISNKPRRKRR